MSQENKEKMGTKNSQMVKITLVSLLAVSLFLIELYEIINDSANMIVIGALGVFLLASVCAGMLLIRKQMDENAKGQEEAFDNVYRSEKASYLLLKKYFDQMEQKLQSLSEPSDLPYKELIAAQKALAKAQINRGKQNTNALLISNDRLMQRINSIQKEIANLNANTSGSGQGLSEQDQAVFTEGNRQVLDKQQEILDGLKVLETSLRNEILESADKMASMKSQQMSAQQHNQLLDQEDIQPLSIGEDFSFEHNLDASQISENSSESDLDKLLMQIDGEESFDSQLGAIDSEDDLSMPELADLDHDLTQPVISEPKSESMMMDTELQPIMAEPELEPIVPELDLPPVMELDAEDVALMTEPEQQTAVLEEPELQPMADEPELVPITEEMELPPMMDEPELAPITEEIGLPPMADEPELVPITEEIGLQPMADEPELAPITEEMGLQPMADEPELASITESAISEPELQPIEEEPELAPVMEEPELAPVMDESELQPIAEEVPSVLNGRPASTEAELQAMIDRLKPKEPEPKEVAEQAKSLSAEPVSEPQQPAVPESDNGEITPDKLAAMVANLGNEPILEEPETEKVEPKPIEVSTLQPEVTDEMVADDELEEIMKAMDIDMDLGQSVQDMDIDKILEVPMSNDNKIDDTFSSSNQVMNSEEIAALIANTKLLSEPEPAKNADLPDLSDPSYVMSSDEIAALIANM